MKKFKKIYIEITNICNLNCPFCSKDNRKKQEISLNDFEHILKQINDYTDYLYLHIKGEPLIHSKIEDILNLCFKYNKQVNITTNGTLLSKKYKLLDNVRQINISLHSLSEDKLLDVLKVWALCWIGNFIGSFLLAGLFYLGGFASGSVGEFIATSSLTKMSVPILPLFIRGVLCNILVCLAVWCGFRCKSESGKLIMVFWCLFVFITAGFEHSVANMTLLSISLLSPMGVAVSLSGLVYNLVVVTLGNMVGAILFVALPYYIISKKKEG